MIEHKFSEEDLRSYVKREVHLEVSFKSMEPTKFKSLDNAATFMGFRSKPLLMLIRIKDLSSPGRKVEPKSSLSNSLRQHNTYPGWILLISLSWD